MILAGDVGGTKTNLARFEPRGGDPGPPLSAESLPSGRYRSLEDLIDDYSSRHPGRCDAACFGIAGAVVDGAVRLTNLPWSVDSTALARKLGLERVHLMNDLSATGYGIPGLQDSELAELQPGTPAEDGNAGIIAAGTGLGESILVRVGRDLIPVPSEGGHADFAPRTDAELRVLQVLRARHGRVSYERVLSGPGLAAVAELVHEERRETAAWRRHLEAASEGGLAGEISRVGIDSSCQSCGEALRLFVGVYGAEAGNMALRAVARGGIYLGGGIAPKILPALKEGAFIEAFRDKEHLRPLLATIPVWVILNEQAALLGAARYAVRAAV